MTCWLRLRARQNAGLWDNLHGDMLDRLNLAAQIDWSRASVDAFSAPATPKGGGDATSPNPTDRGKPGTKRHIVLDRTCIFLSSSS